jgi:hypothetical protein
VKNIPARKGQEEEVVKWATRRGWKWEDRTKGKGRQKSDKEGD